MASAEPYLGLLIQIPLVGIFVWFALELIKSFNTTIERRDESWREYLKQQQTNNNEAIMRMAQRFADEIRVLGKEVAEMRGRHE